jgi:hypothetical protein
MAPNTLRAYRVDWRDFDAWCGVFSGIGCDTRIVAESIDDLRRELARTSLSLGGALNIIEHWEPLLRRLGERAGMDRGHFDELDRTRAWWQEAISPPPHLVESVAENVAGSAQEP